MKQLTFEENLEKLESLVKELESGETLLDDSIDKYTEAMKIAKVCSDKIKKAETIISKILEDNELKEFDIEEE